MAASVGFQKNHNILLAEGDPDHILVFQEAFGETGSNSNLQVVGDGQELARYLKRETGYERSPRPDLIFLDVDLPGKGGLEILSDVKACPSCRRIPIIILASSDDQEQVDRCYELGANSFMTKPLNFDKLIDFIQTSEKYWFYTANLPSR
ncbi:MAG TPA: response regulator [Candidatus Lokiarchaeia archaeon]|nr:response regulator [Candidatus Lokiarchaeia archaeon]